MLMRLSFESRAGHFLSSDGQFDTVIGTNTRRHQRRVGR
jgi:hypothetical protein